MALFTEKVALVTGGTSGIGRATAVAFAREGAKVVVAGRRDAQGEETVKLIQSAGSEGLFVKTDVSQEADVKALVEKTVAAYGRLDFACNNAGVEEAPGVFTEQTQETFDQIMTINVKGVWLSMKYEIPQMLKNGSGAIVNISSGAGLVGLSNIAIYTASKHAVLGLTKSVAIEYAKQGIRVNAVCPGAIETDMFERVGKDTPQVTDIILQMHPIGRIGKPEEIAESVVWLCSDKASFVIGQSLAVDGGYVVQ